jgi:hypothetical protein
VATNDWYLDLDPDGGVDDRPEQVPVFLLAARPSGADIAADLRFRAEDCRHREERVRVRARAGDRVQGRESQAR